MPTAPLLPKIVYIGDVPVESSHYGPLLLYRLFSGYPAEKLLIIETDLAKSSPERRLPKLEYRRLSVALPRLATSRFSKLYSIWQVLFAPYRAGRALRLVKDFKPEAIVTTAHDYHWMTAARMAKQLGVPLHFIIHDHISQFIGLPKPFAGMMRSAFRRVYREAQTRLCVSPYMEREYAKEFGVDGAVLYPSRGSDCPKWQEPPQRDPNSRALRIAYAGSIGSEEYASLMRLLVHALEPDDELVLFGPHSEESIARLELKMKNVAIGGFLPSNKLLERLRNDFDVLFAPMSFNLQSHADNMRLSFPSKIADYTATGLPLLIFGPEYCSAVRWAREYAPVAEIVTSENAADLAEAISRLRSAEHRQALGARALEIGERLFSHQRAEQILHAALTLQSGPRRS